MHFCDSNQDITMGVGRGGSGGLDPHWILTFSAKKGCFSSFEWEEINFTTFGPPRNILEKSPTATPWKKSFRRPWA